MSQLQTCKRTNPKVIFDVHGASPEETEMFSPFAQFYKKKPDSLFYLLLPRSDQWGPPQRIWNA